LKYAFFLFDEPFNSIVSKIVGTTVGFYVVSNTPHFLVSMTSKVV